MRLSIDLPGGPTVLVDVAALQTVDEVMLKIRDHWSRLREPHCLIFQSSLLDEARTLFSYDIRHGDVLTLVPRSSRTKRPCSRETPPSMAKRASCGRSARSLCSEYVSIAQDGDDRGWLCSQFPRNCLDDHVYCSDSSEDSETAVPEPPGDGMCASCMAALIPVSSLLDTDTEL